MNLNKDLPFICTVLCMQMYCMSQHAPGYPSPSEPVPRRQPPASSRWRLSPWSEDFRSRDLIYGPIKRHRDVCPELQRCLTGQRSWRHFRSSHLWRVGLCNQTISPTHLSPAKIVPSHHFPYQEFPITSVCSNVSVRKCHPPTVLLP